MGKYDYLMIHCTDTPAGMEVTKAMIEQWHLKERGWSKVGYNQLIHINGWRQQLRKWNGNGWIDSQEISNGARGFNSVTRHICYVGGKGGDTRTDMQKKRMLQTIKDDIKRNPDIIVIGHNQVSSSKSCPSFDVYEWCKSVGIPEKNLHKGKLT